LTTLDVLSATLALPRKRHRNPIPSLDAQFGTTARSIDRRTPRSETRKPENARRAAST
jgi:hypothetical protein